MAKRVNANEYIPPLRVKVNKLYVPVSNERELVHTVKFRSFLKENCFYYLNSISPQQSKVKYCREIAQTSAASKVSNILNQKKGYICRGSPLYK